MRGASGRPTASVAMPNTSSARKAVRKIARVRDQQVAPVANAQPRAQGRGSNRGGDRSTALAALKEAEPAIMRAAQKGIVHSNAASRKVSRLGSQGRQARHLVRPARLLETRHIDNLGE